MQGYSTLWMPGTDHASIATEVKIVDALRVTKERPRKNWDAINSWNARGNGAKNLAEGLHGS